MTVVRVIRNVVLFILLFVMALTAFGGAIGPYELVIIPLLIIAGMWGVGRLVRLGAR